eukprot:g25848.t1
MNPQPCWNESTEGTRNAVPFETPHCFDTHRRCSIGSGALLYLYTYFADVWEGPVPKEVVTVLAYFLVFGGLCLLVRIFYLATLNARRPVHIKINEKVKKKSSLLLDCRVGLASSALKTPTACSLQLKAQTLQLTRLVVLLERSLLQELHWLQHLATEENERPPTETSTMTGASSSSRSFRLQLVDCLIDVPSDALSRQWPCSSPNGLAERTLDTEQWRLVLSLARVDLRIRSQAQKTAQRSLLLRCGRIQGYLSDHPANLSQLELWSESTGEFLSSMGFAPILEISSASCSAGKETAKEALLIGQWSGWLRSR